MPSDNLDAAGADTARRPMNPRVLIFAIVFVIVGAILVISTVARGDVGVLKTDSTGVSKVLTDAEVDAKMTRPLTLLEGGDVVHESEHVFQSLAGLPGIGRVFLAADGARIEVDYDSKVTGEAQVEQALAEAGYVAPPAAAGTP